MQRLSLGILGVCALLIAPSAVVAADSNADWVRKPDANTLTNAWPRQAPGNIPAHVRLLCRALPTGDLSDCRVLDETPRGEGFGAAALGVSSTFKMKPATRDGSPVESSVIIPVAFAPNRDDDGGGGSGSQPVDWLSPLLGALVFVAGIGWYGWIFYSPPSDTPRIKRDLEADGAKVISVVRNGTRLGGRYSPSYRVYSVAVRERDGETLTRQICVQVTLFSDPSVVEAKTTDFVWFRKGNPKTPKSPEGGLDL